MSGLARTVLPAAAFVLAALLAGPQHRAAAAEQEIFWRETTTEKIKIAVEEDRVVSRWVFPKKSAHGSKARVARLVPGKPLTNAQGMTMAWIPPGSFTMGSSDYEEGRDVSEGPTRLVTFTEGFWMSTTELTQTQYEHIVGENPSQARHSLLPVERVSWNDAVEFCNKLTARERAAGRLPMGFCYRLPTEAEWEYACRANTTAPVYDLLERVAWYADNGEGESHRIASLHPNAWGIFDMLGNVSEWCLDGWTADYRGAPTDGSVVVGERTPEKVVRGGSYRDGALRCRAAARDKAGVQFKHAAPWRGFRCVVAASRN